MSGAGASEIFLTTLSIKDGFCSERISSAVQEAKKKL
jgi:hypothetical protein